MTKVWIDKQALVKAISCGTDANEQDAKAIVNAVLAKMPREHDGECATDKYTRSVCEGMYSEKVGEKLELVEALRAVYAIAGEDYHVGQIIETALADYE